MPYKEAQPPTNPDYGTLGRTWEPTAPPIDPEGNREHTKREQGPTAAEQPGLTPRREVPPPTNPDYGRSGRTWEKNAPPIVPERQLGPRARSDSGSSGLQEMFSPPRGGSPTTTTASRYKGDGQTHTLLLQLQRQAQKLRMAEASLYRTKEEGRRPTQ